MVVVVVVMVAEVVVVVVQWCKSPAWRDMSCSSVVSGVFNAFVSVLLLL